MANHALKHQQGTTRMQMALMVLPVMTPMRRRRWRMHQNGIAAQMRRSLTVQHTYFVHSPTANKSYAYSLDISANIHSSQPKAVFIKPQLKSVNSVYRKCTISVRCEGLVKFGLTCGHHGTHCRCGNYGLNPAMGISFLSSKPP